MKKNKLIVGISPEDIGLFKAVIKKTGKKVNDVKEVFESAVKNSKGQPLGIIVKEKTIGITNSNYYSKFSDDLYDRVSVSKYLDLEDSTAVEENSNEEDNNIKDNSTGTPSGDKEVEVNKEDLIEYIKENKLDIKYNSKTTIEELKNLISKAIS